MDTHGQKKIQTMAQRKRDYRRENYNGGHATLAKLYGLTGSIEYYIIFFFALFFYLFFATSTARVLNVNRNHRKFQYQQKKQTHITLKYDLMHWLLGARFLRHFFSLLIYFDFDFGKWNKNQNEHLCVRR